MYVRTTFGGAPPAPAFPRTSPPPCTFSSAQHLAHLLRFSPPSMAVRLALSLLLLCARAAGHTHGGVAHAATGACPHFRSENRSTFALVCGAGTAAEPAHAGAHAAQWAEGVRAICAVCVWGKRGE